MGGSTQLVSSDSPEGVLEMYSLQGRLRFWTKIILIVKIKQEKGGQRKDGS